jgi:peptide chain release factor 3
MVVERERGISVSLAVMSFEHEGLASNLLDTPGHQDFGEETYRSGWALSNHAVAIIAWYSRAYRCPRLGGEFALEGVGDT